MTLSEAIGARLNALFNVPELKKRVIFTLAMFMIARIGVYIAVPGLNMELFKQFQSSNAIASFLNLFSGGAVERASILSLGITPYINASIVFQLLGIIFPKIDEMQKEGGKERDKITQWTRYVTIGLALVQSFGLALTLMNQGLVIEPGTRFVISTMTLVTGGTAFLMWLSERISIKGIGNGTSMLIFLGIVTNLPGVIQQMFISLKGGMGYVLIGVSLLLFIGVIALMVITQLAERRIPIQYAGKGSLGFGGGQSTVGRRTYLPLKINMSGVMPIIFASVLITGYVGMYFWQLSTSTTHILYLLLSSLIIPITYCMRILEGCIDKIVNLEAVVENSCMRFIKIPD